MRALLFVLLTFISATSMAQTSNLVVFNQSGKQFFVILNGIKQNAMPQTNVKVQGLDAITYKVKIIFADGITGDLDKTVYMEANKEYTAEAVVKSGKKSKFKWFSMTDLNTSGQGRNSQVVTYRPNDNYEYSDIKKPVGSQNGTHTHADGTVHDQNHQPVKQPANTHTHADGTVHDQNHQPVKPKPGTHTHADGTVHDQNHQPVKPGTHTHADGTVHDQNHQPVNNNKELGSVVYNADGSYTCKTAVASVDLIATKMQQMSFASDQMTYLESELKSKCINSDQAYRLVNSFTFDGDKIKMAKLCFDHMVDKNNASKLLDLFKFSSSKTELQQYFEKK